MTTKVCYTKKDAVLAKLEAHMILLTIERDATLETEDGVTTPEQLREKVKEYYKKSLYELDAIEQNSELYKKKYLIHDTICSLMGFN